VICILGLICLGLILLNNKSFGVSADGKILLKTLHAYFGYVFVLNLAWRLIWGFIGNKYSRWRTILPFGKGYIQSARTYAIGLAKNDPPHYAGHNPIAKLMVSVLFALLFTQATTGLILAGTDLYLPPFGHEIAEWVTGSGEDHSKLAELKPGSKEGVDPEGYKEMRDFRKPFITVHVYVFYILIITILLHIIGVIVTELKERSGLVSAMFTGKKVFRKKPIDNDVNE
jgi:cytochrome b